MRRFAPPLSVIFLLTVALVGCGASGSSSGTTSSSRPQSATIMLDWYPNSDHGGIFAALQEGFFRRESIAPSVKTPSSSTSQISLVGTGHADFGVTYETDLLAARTEGVPVRSVMCIMQHPLDTVMALRSSHITRPRDLVGKKIGMAGSPSDNPIVAAMMAHDGASISQADMVNVGYNLLPALLAGKVDAVVGVYWTWEAIQARQKGYPVNVMRVERWGVPNYCELVLIANEQTIRQRPKYVRHVVHALQDGYMYAESHPAAAWAALHARDSTLNRSLVLESLRKLRPAITDAPEIGYQNPRQWRHYAAWLYTNKLIKKRVDSGAAFTDRFLGGVA